MTNRGQRINTVKIKPNQSVPALIPLDRQQTEWLIVIEINQLISQVIN